MNDLALVVEALDFAARAHARQRRKDKAQTPYINHPLAVVRILACEAGISDPLLLAAAALHDTIEDTAVTRSLLLSRFGGGVTQLVEHVTDDKSLPPARRKALQIEHGPTLPHHARLLKIADKLANVRDLVLEPPHGWDDERRLAYVQWAQAVVSSIRGTHPALEEAFHKACDEAREAIACETALRAPGDDDGSPAPSCKP